MFSVRSFAEMLAKDIVSAGGNTVFFTGAGISTESGIPDFRGPRGLWTRISPEVFDIENFYRDPDRGWKLYIEYIYDVVSRAAPNPAHRAIAQLEAMGLVKAVITQNIDRLHQKAGSRNVIELHGAYDEVECGWCGFRDRIEEYVEEFRRSGRAPRCPSCGKVLKPAVVYFGEPLPAAALAEAFTLARTCEIMVVIGTSLAVYPAALIPSEACRSSAKLYIVNLAPTPLDHLATAFTYARAGKVLPQVVEHVEKLMGTHASS